MLAAVGRHSSETFLSHIDVPTLVVSGIRDGFTPAALSREMASRIPGAHLMEVEDGTHTAPIERPVEIDAKISEFLVSKVDHN